MKFTSILDLRRNPDADAPRAVFFQDLNLNRVIERICQEWEEDVSSLYYYFPADKACEDYRRAVFADVKQDGVYDVLCGFVERMCAWEEADKQKERVYSQLQKMIWHVNEVQRYCEAFLGLDRELSGFCLKSQGLLMFREYLKEYLASDYFQELAGAVRDIRERLGKIQMVLSYENGRISVSFGEVEGAYDSFLRKCFPDNPRQLRSPFKVSPDLSDLETELLKLVQRRKPELFREMTAFKKKYRDYADETLLCFADEIKFYLSFYCFERKMQEAGCVFAEPGAADHERMYAAGLYDLALACVNMREGRETVSNDMEYRQGEQFFVLTGPNQGGKTTFARSLGQLVYFTKMGLDVPAAEANVHYFREILTHFSVEESLDTGRGKLKEVLVRV